MKRWAVAPAVGVAANPASLMTKGGVEKLFIFILFLADGLERRPQSQHFASSTRFSEKRRTEKEGEIYRHRPPPKEEALPHRAEGFRVRPSLGGERKSSLIPSSKTPAGAERVARTRRRYTGTRLLQRDVPGAALLVLLGKQSNREPLFLPEQAGTQPGGPLSARTRCSDQTKDADGCWSPATSRGNDPTVSCTATNYH